MDVIELGDTTLKRNPGQPFLKCPDLTPPEMKAGGITKSHFLVDTAEVVALHTNNIDSPKVRAKQRYFISLLRQAGKEAPMPGLLRLSECLSNQQMLERIRSRLTEQKARPNDKVTLRVGDSFPVESDTWHDGWHRFRKGLSSKRPRAIRLARCFASGELSEASRTHPKVKGLVDVDGLTMGDVLA